MITAVENQAAARDLCGLVQQILREELDTTREVQDNATPQASTNPPGPAAQAPGECSVPR